MATDINWTSGVTAATGYVAAGYEAVAREFEQNFTERGDVGAHFAAWQGGRPLVDIWGGEAVPGRPWQSDTLQIIFSGTKGLVAACVLKLIEQGKLDLDAPVARYWPEFSQAQKHAVRVRHVVSHTAGLPGILEPLTPDQLTDTALIEDLLARQPLANDPNAFNAYHALTIGWLVGALVRRIDGRSIGRFFAEEFAAPWALDAYIGLPEALEPRVGRMRTGPGMGPWNAGQTPEQHVDPYLKAVWGNPPLFADDDMAWNTPDYHRAEIAGAGGIADARSMARFYAGMANGGILDSVRVLKPETVLLGRQELSRFLDPYIAELMAYGVMWALQTPQGRFGPDPAAFGHSGAGGSIHGAWPDHGVGFSYTMNQMRVDPQDQRSRPLLAALYRALPT